MIKNFNEWLNENEIYNIFSLDEATITTIKGFNQESDVVILVMDYYKDNKEYKDIISKIGIDFFNGNVNIYDSLVSKFRRMIKVQHVEKVLDDYEDKSLAFSILSSSDSKIIDFFSKLLAQGVKFELRENPIQFTRKVGDSKLIKAADSFSINRGKEKFGTMLDNKKGK